MIEVDNFSDVEEIALKLNEIHKENPDDFFYLKGYISCLANKEKENNKKFQEKINAEHN